MEEMENIYKKMLSCGKIQPQVSRPLKEMGRVDDSRYCHYHQIISHPTNECYTLRDTI